ncbi:MAG: hypothetical protein IJ461_03060 [Clostridia bacterium]|nr:hypothetical protein [Clostridia bacterium]
MNKKKWLILLVVADILLLAVIAGIVMTQGQSPQRKEASALPKEVNLENITQGMSHVTYAPEAVMRNGQIAIRLSNGEKSPYAIRAEIILPQTNTVIAQTNWIDPGYRLENMKTAEKLPTGQYPCLMRIELATAQGESIGKAGRSLLLSVQ